MIVSYAELAGTLERALAALGLEPDRAPRCAQLIADSTRDGVPSHGLNLFPRVASMIRRGAIDPRARAIRVAGRGALERWDGRRGVGALNAFDAMQTAIAGARASGIACVALGNTNHWMRGGSYGWQAADAGAIALCWTNTLPNLPPWGAASPRIGNNPLVVAVPRARGHVVLDMAMSQFSFGALESYPRRAAPGRRRLRSRRAAHRRPRGDRGVAPAVADRLLERIGPGDRPRHHRGGARRRPRDARDRGRSRAGDGALPGVHRDRSGVARGRGHRWRRRCGRRERAGALSRRAHARRAAAAPAAGDRGGRRGLDDCAAMRISVRRAPFRPS